MGKRPVFISCCLIGFMVGLTNFTSARVVRAQTMTVEEMGTPMVGNLNTPWEAQLRDDFDAMRKLFGYRPHIFYINEKESPNALAVATVYPSMLARDGSSVKKDPDGTIFLGINLIRSEWRDGDGVRNGLPMIVAHEFGHIIQFKMNCDLTGKWRELEADYFAGYFTAYRNTSRKQDVDQAMRSLYNKGDYGFFSRDHHGTPEERVSAFLAGELAESLSAGHKDHADYYKGATEYIDGLKQREGLREEAIVLKFDQGALYYSVK